MNSYSYSAKSRRKIALVTGAGGMRSVGRVIALRLAANGYDVAVTDVARDPDELGPGEARAGWRGISSVADEFPATGRECHPVIRDLGDPEAIAGLVSGVTQRFSRLDVLVNNARAIVGRDNCLTTELPDDVFLHTMTINTTAVFRLTKLVGQLMVNRGGGGRIINIASTSGKEVPAPRMAAYAASKFAMIGLTQASTLDLAPHHITSHHCQCCMPRLDRHESTELLGAGPSGGNGHVVGGFSGHPYRVGRQGDPPWSHCHP